MNDNFRAFLAEMAATSYPEPRSDGHDKITRTMLAKVTPMMRNGGVVLDVGCGSGPALEWLDNHDIQAIGTTVNSSDLKACQNCGWDVRECDMNDMPFSDGSFALVWARHVLEHSICPMWTLREFWRVTERGGLLFVEVPGPDTSCQHETNRNHYSVLGWKAWQCLIDRSGFDVKECAQIDLETSVGEDRYFYFIATKHENPTLLRL